MSKSLSGPVKNSITGKTNKVVIFFHGYGADGNDLISLSDSFINTIPDAVYYSPNAPEKCEMGGLGFQWFPIKQNNDGSLDLNAEKEITNSIIEDIIISFFEKPKILKIRFWNILIFPWTIIALEITTKPIITVTAEIILTAINTLLSTSVTFDK